MPIVRVRDLADPRVSDYRDVRDADRRRDDSFVAESRGVVRELLACGRFPVRSLLVTEPAYATLHDVHDRIPAHTPVFVTDQPTIRGVVGFDFHHGCLAIGERGSPLDTENLLAAQPRLVVVLEDVTNHDNVGGIFRNAMAFGVGGVLLSRDTADPLYRKAVRVSIGGTLHVPFARETSLRAGLDRLRRAGFVLVALDARRGASVSEIADVPERMALLVGSEGRGLGTEIREAVDLTVTIPMAAGVDSLNVSTATGIALHRFARFR